jgi:ADP-ribose pyrophosphatase YjhB (NUDIX family)
VDDDAGPAGAERFAADLAAEGEAEAEHVAGVAARMPRKRVTAGALFRDGAGRLLLVEPVYKPWWEVPGGVVEAGEEPLAGCRREVLEELGLALPVGDLLVVDWAPAWGVWGDSVNLLFDGGMLAADALRDVRLQASELRAVHWVPPGEVGARVRPGMARRLVAALAAAASGRPAYLAFGRSPGAGVESPGGRSTPG